MKEIKFSKSELAEIDSVARKMSHNTYQYYDTVREMRTNLLQERAGDNTLIFKHESDLKVYREIVRPEGFTNRELIDLQGYGIDQMPYHCLNDDGKVCHQKENGGISMSLGAPEYSIGALVTTITVPAKCTVIVE